MYNKIKKETTCCTFKLPVRRQTYSGVFKICENKVIKERIKTAGVFSFDLLRTYVLFVFGGGFPLLRKFVVFDLKKKTNKHVISPHFGAYLC